MIIAYRRFSVVVLGILPIASAGVAGLAAVSAMFGSIHGITLGFGFTLLGVAQDYPMHLFSHQHPGKPAVATARHVWPTLATGVVSTCIAYLAFLCSGVTGLAQLACFTISGLAVAGLTTRYLLPPLMPLKPADYGRIQVAGSRVGRDHRASAPDLAGRRRGCSLRRHSRVRTHAAVAERSRLAHSGTAAAAATGRQAAPGTAVPRTFGACWLSMAPRPTKCLRASKP